MADGSPLTDQERNVRSSSARETPSGTGTGGDCQTSAGSALGCAVGSTAIKGGEQLRLPRRMAS